MVFRIMCGPIDLLRLGDNLDYLLINTSRFYLLSERDEPHSSTNEDRRIEW